MVLVIENPTKEKELSEDSNLHIYMWKEKHQEKQFENNCHLGFF